MFRLLAVCHTVIVEKDERNGEISYQASSPDELALIQGAKQIGFILKDKTSNSMTIENIYSKKNETYEILAELPFDSTRKRMSLIVRYEGQVIIMSKGADSILIPRCNFKTEAQQEQLSKIMEDLLTFAKEGLRTLVVA